MKPIKKISSFADKRVQDRDSRYKKALDERKKLVRAQYAADKPLDKTYKFRANVVDRKISRLKPSNERS